MVYVHNAQMIYTYNNLVNVFTKNPIANRFCQQFHHRSGQPGEVFQKLEELPIDMELLLSLLAFRANHLYLPSRQPQPMYTQGREVHFQ